MVGKLSWRSIFSLSRVTGELVSSKAEHDVWSCWDEMIIGIRWENQMLPIRLSVLKKEEIGFHPKCKGNFSDAGNTSLG